VCSTTQRSHHVTQTVPIWFLPIAGWAYVADITISGESGVSHYLSEYFGSSWLRRPWRGHRCPGSSPVSGHRLLAGHAALCPFVGAEDARLAGETFSIRTRWTSSSLSVQASDRTQSSKSISAASRSVDRTAPLVLIPANVRLSTFNERSTTARSLPVSKLSDFYR
jgi:hypothetical protein